MLGTGKERVSLLLGYHELLDPCEPGAASIVLRERESLELKATHRHRTEIRGAKQP